MELRQLTQADEHAQSMLGGEAFSGGLRPPPATMPAIDAGADPHNLHLGIFDGTRLVAASTVHDFHVTWGDHDARMGGVAGVMCAADQRGRGHAGRLIKECLVNMREAGQYLSALDPFSYAFYRRLGWDWVGERRIHTLPLADLPADPEGRNIRFYDGVDGLEIIKPLYSRFARRYRGMMTREDPSRDFWHGLLAPEDNRTRFVYVHQDTDGIADGYMVFRYPQTGDTGRVTDFAALSPAAYKGLLSVLHHLGMKAEKASICAPADSLLPAFFMSNNLETKITTNMMGRIVDVPAAFAALHPSPALTGSVILHVSDSQCDWNDGAFAVTAEAGRITVDRTDHEARISLDIQTLSQAYWGHPSLAALRDAGRVSVTDEAQFALLSAILPPAIAYLPDDF